MAHMRTCLVAVLLLAGMLQASVAQAHPIAAGSGSAVPYFTSGPCPFKPGSGFTVGVNLRCGTLYVEIDHAHPGTGVMRLAVAILRTPSPNRRPDPVVYLTGGPGYGALDMGPDLRTKDAPDSMGNHDLILIDQRGTGRSLPRPSCIPADAQGHDPSASNAAFARYLMICHARLDRLGKNPSFFTTTQSAGDIADLRTALNLPPINLYSISYGTTLALEIMRLYPDDLRSVVLDSVIPTNFSLGADGIRAESRGFHALFVGCSRSTHCRKQFPNLKRTFHHLLTRLNHHAAVYITRGKKGRASKHYVTGNDFAELIRELLYDTGSLPDLPGLVAKVNAGKYQELQQYFQSTTQGFSGNSPGVYRSIVCAEDIPLDTPGKIAAAIATLPNAIKADAASSERDQLAECRAWNVPEVDPRFYDPVQSAVPTLILAGEFDPIAPPSNAIHVAATLSHSYHYLFPGTGHGVRFTDPCPDRMVNQFYDLPNQAPNSSCIAQISEPF